MRFRRVDGKKKIILDYLYDMYKNPTESSDPSVRGISRVFGLKIHEVSRELKQLSEMAFVRPFFIGREKCYKITTYGIREIEKKTEKWYKGEIGTSGIGVAIGSKKTS